MAFLLNKATVICCSQSHHSQVQLPQPRRGFHITPGARERALLAEDHVLNRFKSDKKSVYRLKRLGDALAIVVIAGCCYGIYVKSVMREEARKQAQALSEGA